MATEIEKASCHDAEAILEYLKQVGAETDNLTFGAEGLPFTVEEEAAYLKSQENSRDRVTFLAKEHGKIIGDASLERLPRRMKHRGDVGIAVTKEYWNRGVGTLLLNEILQFAKENDFEVLELQVRCDNVAAIRLYEKFGFRKFGTQEAFFKMGEEEIAFDYMSMRVER